VANGFSVANCNFINLETTVCGKNHTLVSWQKNHTSNFIHETGKQVGSWNKVLWNSKLLHDSGTKVKSTPYNRITSINLTIRLTVNQYHETCQFRLFIQTLIKS
jgi:hypothetical protein